MRREPAWNHPATHPRVSSSLPPEVVTCLENARFLHLSTCSANTPHISLMNYTYLATTPFPSHPGPTIIMTTPPASKKTSNLTANPLVSLLVHDWVSHRPPTLSSSPPGPGPAPGSGSFGGRRPSAAAGERTSLAGLLLGMNTAALSRISTTINGTAALLARGAAEEAWFKAQHRAHNTFGDEGEAGAGAGIGAGLFGGVAEEEEEEEGRGGEDGEVGDGGAGCYIDGDEVRVVVVRIRDGRIADWKGAVRDWVVAAGDGEGEGEGEGEADEGLVNGV